MYDFTADIPEYVSDILYQLNRAGFEAYIVGGCVRDTLMGRTPNDWDICTSALPAEIISVLCGYKIIETGIAHGTVTAVKDKNVCEITTFRCDGNYTDHRRPDMVTFTKDIKYDLARRDFTINAMAFSNNTGLLDLFDGRADLKKMLIRCVGEPQKRFNEDALRIMRALRFSSVLGFDIDISTQEAIISCSPLINYVARERIFSELKLLLCGKNAHYVIERYPIIFDLLFGYKNFSANAFMLANAPEILELRLALLFHEASADVILSALKNIKADNKTIKGVLLLVGNSSFPLASDTITIRKMLSLFGKNNAHMLTEYICISQQKSESEKIDIQKQIDITPVITLKELEINGADLIRLGYTEGKQIKSLLDAALDSVITEKCINEKKALLKHINTSKQ